MIAGAQSTTKNRESARETQVRVYWVGPSTGLMWAGKDNGKAATWHKAVSYCRNQRLARYSDWRLATLDELASLVDKSNPTPERVGNIETLCINVGSQVRGNLSLTDDPWSSNREKKRFGHPYRNGWFFDFVSSKPSYDLQLIRNTKYALCVRCSEKDRSRLMLWLIGGNQPFARCPDFLSSGSVRTTLLDHAGADPLQRRRW